MTIIPIPIPAKLPSGLFIMWHGKAENCIKAHLAKYGERPGQVAYYLEKQGNLFVQVAHD